MNEHYVYEDLYGTLEVKNEDDTERIYFISQSEFWKFYKWMFSRGWNLVEDLPCERKGIIGYEVKLIKNNPVKSGLL